MGFDVFLCLIPFDLDFVGVAAFETVSLCKLP
jgi:hypothetical protein